MGKILLVEPGKILRHAVILCLFPENEVDAEAGIPNCNAELLEEYDLIIIDGDEILGRGWWSPELHQAIGRGSIPVLWLGSAHPLPPPEADKQAVLCKPLDKLSLREAVASLLAISGPGKKGSPHSAEGSAPDAGEVKMEEPAPASSEQGAQQLIDLVDAVEDEASPHPLKKEPGRMP